MDTLKPLKIEEGFLKRWTRQTWQLWRREPWLFGVNFLGIPLLMLISSQYFIGTLLNIFVTSLVVLQLKLIDKQTFTISEFLILLKNNLKNIVLLAASYLTIYALDYVFVMSAFWIGKFMSHPVVKNSHIQPIPLLHNPQAFELIIYNNIMGFTLFVGSIFIGMYIYLCLLVGFNIMQNFALIAASFLVNLKINIGYMLVVFFIVISYIILPSILEKIMSTNNAYFVAILSMSFILMVVLTFLYLLCRETFEGKIKEKVTEKIKNKTKVGQILPSLN